MYVKTTTEITYILPEDDELHRKFLETQDLSQWKKRCWAGNHVTYTSEFTMREVGVTDGLTITEVD